MASNYGLNFGFRRSDESVRVAEGRFKTPVAGPALLLGTAVVIDTATPGYVKAAPTTAPLVTGLSGILIQEEIMFRSIYEQDILDIYFLGIAKLNKLSVITSGPGTKVWLKNSPIQNRADGRIVPAVNLVDVTGVAVGDFLGWTAGVWAKTAAAAAQWMVVTQVSGAGPTAYVEAVLSA